MSKRYGCGVRGVCVAVVVMLLCVCGSVSAADDSISISELQVGLDTVWVLLGAFLVFFMQAGFGMLEAGFIRGLRSNSGLARQLTYFQAAMDDWRYITRYTKAIADIGKADIQGAVRRYLTAKNRTVVTLLPPEETP